MSDLLEVDALSTTARKRARTRTGCWNCRRKRKKCNERRPVCDNCFRKGEDCDWGIKLSFRDENLQTIPQSHPSMRRDKGNRREGVIEVVNITNEVIRDYWAEVHAAERLEHSPSDASPTRSHGNGHNGSGNGTHGEPHSSDDTYTSGLESRSTNSAVRTQQATSFSSPSFTRSELRSSGEVVPPDALRASISSGFGGEPNHDSPASAANTSHSYDIIQSAAVQLLDLCGSSTAMNPMLNPLPSQAHPSGQLLQSPPQVQVMEDITEATGVSPEQLFDDGIFMPGSAYLELHSVLRDHIFETARSTYASRRPSPRPALPEDQALDGNTPPARDTALYPDQADQSSQLLDATPRGAELTKHEEYVLWKNWVDEIAPWLDKFDNACHFKQKLPALAKDHAHLRYSMLALSACQQERKYPGRSTSASLPLYQEAIHQLVPHLQTKSTEVVASCVVLCVLEMMNCSPQMWRRHLDGCAFLMKSLGINGFSGGVEQALFWCFARMDVCGGLISSVSTLIPTASWTPRMSLAGAVELFQQTPGLDMYACFAVFLCAQVLTLFACDDSDAEYTRRWNELFAYIEDWYHQRPAEMRSILSQPASDDTSSPFPALLFSNPPAISGNQQYHTAALLMLQKKPRRAILPPRVRPVLWHARRICAISISNKHHGCWTNCIQPLWIAGQVMSHNLEHRAILKAYEEIERETGFGALWRAEDLKAHWAELDKG